jgi:hypothetical protein
LKRRSFIGGVIGILTAALVPFNGKANATEFPSTGGIPVTGPNGKGTMSLRKPTKVYDVLAFNGQTLFPQYSKDGGLGSGEMLFWTREDKEYAVPGYYRAKEWPSLKPRLDLEIFDAGNLPEHATPSLMAIH